jgi:beta-mannosidase
VVLRFGGIATVSEAWLNRESILNSGSMFAVHEVEVSHLLRGRNELLIVCRSLQTAVRSRRAAKPPLRWRTRVVGEQQLRWFRTTLLGRAPGFAPQPETVGPWRPVTLIRRSLIALQRSSLRATLTNNDSAADARSTRARGSIEWEGSFRVLDPRGSFVSGELVSRDFRSPLQIDYSGSHLHCSATLRLSPVDLWWPHTHGQPVLYPVRLELQLASGTELIVEESPVGFRTVRAPDVTSAENSFRIEVNKAPIFCCGVVWTPPDPVSLTASAEAIHGRLMLLRDAGFNLIRLAGTTVYEPDSFHRSCDQLGLLVWQDMMFANMDYPFADADFHSVARREAERELARLSYHASTVLVCGNSEIEQQTAMLGLDPSLGRGPFFAEELAQMVCSYCPGVPYISSAPSGGELPFRTRSGVANYFGVGAYLRPLEDARHAAVPFASECLAFSNVPEPELLDKMDSKTPGGISPTHPAWKQSVPRDAGAGWDFEDVRDHYLRLLYGLDPVRLRYSELSRYWELSRMVSGEVMAEVFGEWRRTASCCSGAIILWAADLQPGGGWGILDSNGWPKAAYWFLKRALAPRAVWMTDEGLNGIDVHIANDSAAPFRAFLRVALYRKFSQQVDESSLAVEVPGRSAMAMNVEQIFGRFVDASYAYRFGPPGHDLIVASLHDAPEAAPLSQSFRFPAGRSAAADSISELGLSGEGVLTASGNVEVSMKSRCFAYGVRIAAPGFLPTDAYFGIEPGGQRALELKPFNRVSTRPVQLTVTAANAIGVLNIPVEGAG